MKKLFVTLVSIVAFSGFVFGQEAATENKNAPEIEFTSVVHDFGTIPYEGNGTYTFEFKNVGKEPLVLGEVRSSCGCTTPEYTKSPIKKGEKGQIKVTYNTKIIGPFTKSIYVPSNAKTQNVTLTIKGTVSDKK